MRTITRTIYTFDELPTESARDRAREWGRVVLSEDPPWGDEWADSLRAFCDEFGARIVSYSVGPYSSPDYRIEFDNSNFRGRRLREFNRGHMPTGFCGDCAFWQKFVDEFARTGNARGAFDSALWAGFIEWRDDFESQLENEYIDDFLSANECEFDETGERV